MDVYLIRHAVAEPRGLERPDHERALTEDGTRRFEAVVAALERLGVRFDLVLHSPWRRAAQTAALLAPLTEGPVVETEELAADPGDELLREVTGMRVAMVGHEPWMGELLALLVHAEASAGAAYVFKKGGVAWLRGDPSPGGMELRALMPPKVLRQIG